MSNFFLVLVFLFNFLLTNLYAQNTCEGQELEALAEQAVRKVPADFIFSRCFPAVFGDKLHFNPEKGVVEYAMIMSEKYQYCFAVSSNQGHCEGITIYLHDKNENVVATNYEIKEGKEHNRELLIFKVPHGGVYHLRFNVKNKKICGNIAKAFKEIR